MLVAEKYREKLDQNEFTILFFMMLLFLKCANSPQLSKILAFGAVDSKFLFLAYI